MPAENNSRAAVSQSEEIRCSNCNNYISGKKYYYENNPRCGSCYAKITREKLGKNQKPSASQIRDMLKQTQNYDVNCKGCGRKIKNNEYYILSDNRKYCENCQKKMTNTISSQCISCKRTIKGTYYKMSDGTRCCETCYKSLPHCSNCNNVVTKDTIQQDQDYKLCKNCAKTAINDFNSLMGVWMDVKKSIKQNTRIEVVFDENNLALETKAIIKKSGEPNREGYSVSKRITTTANGIKTHRDIYNIYTQKGLPYTRMFAVLCHEYAHVFLYRENFENAQNQEKIFAEGFAEWLAYKCCLGENLTKEAAKIKNSKNPVYGEGIRKMLRLEQKLGGTQAVIDYAKTNKNFPQGI